MWVSKLGLVVWMEKELPLSASLVVSVFICVVCREMDHVNMFSSCTFLLLHSFMSILRCHFQQDVQTCTYCWLCVHVKMILILEFK